MTIGDDDSNNINIIMMTSPSRRVKNSTSEGPWVDEQGGRFSYDGAKIEQEEEEEVDEEEEKDGTLATRNPKHLTADASILSLSCWWRIQWMMWLEYLWVGRE
jgi:hypothetical protein